MTYKLRKLQFILIFLLLICMTTVSLSLNVHAEFNVSGSEVEAQSAEGSSQSGSTSTSTTTSKWYSTYGNGMGNKGQGVLVYLLYRNGGGAVEGTTPKAYACSSAVEAYTLNAQDKYGRYAPVTQWESGKNPPWASSVSDNNGAIIKSKSSSNTEAIKSWLTTHYGANSTNGINMVAELWGEAVAEKFTNNELVLIVEPILANQFSQSKKIMNTTQYSTSNSMYELINALETILAIPSAYPDTSVSSDFKKDAQSYIDSYYRGDDNDSFAEEVDRYDIASMLNKTSVKLYKKLGEPYAGTAKDLIAYYETLTPDTGFQKSESGCYYYRWYAQAFCYIDTSSRICQNMGFSLWDKGKTGIQKLNTTEDINSKSIGMIALMAWGDGGQTTCDEPSIPSEHKAPDESTGTYTIVKNYRI
jgi:hypothetical protein